MRLFYWYLHYIYDFMLYLCIMYYTVRYLTGILYADNKISVFFCILYSDSAGRLQALFCLRLVIHRLQTLLLLEVYLPQSQQAMQVRSHKPETACSFGSIFFGNNPGTHALCNNIREKLALEFFVKKGLRCEDLNLILHKVCMPSRCN